jgi:7,8-dihydropterin-6-yl-methyl-4-(beta-D-ribofuranosyl)aminobenzene 5'-phosphate synthase
MVRITTLTDNHALPGSDLESEHGFSCFLEIQDVRILFDTGKSDMFLRNAEKLHVDLSRIDHLIISHGHYDHGGGVQALIDHFEYPALSMWTGKGFDRPKFVDDPDGIRMLNPDIDAKQIYQQNIMWHTVCNDVVMIHPGIWLVTNFDRIHAIEKPNPRFFLEEGDHRIIDPFNDEISLVVDCPQGLLMVAGCSHPGILNMVDTVRSRFSRPLFALIGGIHLYDASDERRKAVVAGLIDRKIPHVGVSHCTGDEAAEMLKTSCEGFFVNCAGQVTEFADCVRNA